MHISVSGSFSTGKTTLVTAARDRLVAEPRIDVVAIEEVARGVIARGYRLDKEATLDSYLNYILAQLSAERASRVHNHVISDRSLIDLLAYVRVNKDPKVPNDLNSLLEEIVWLEAQYFDIYCYIPVEFPPQNDGIRSTDINYQLEVDRELVKLFREYKISTVRISGAKEARLEAFVSLFTGSLVGRSGT